MGLTLEVHNELDAPVYARFGGMPDGIDASGRFVYEPGLHACYKLAHGKGKLTFQDGRTFPGGCVWGDTNPNTVTKGQRTWSTIAEQTDQSGPFCTQLELTIEPTKVNYDITHVRGLCHGVQTFWKRSGGGEEPGASCAYVSDGGAAFVAPSDTSATDPGWRHNAECPDGTSKECCHRFMAAHSYATGGYCDAIHTAKGGSCQAYCWTYDEKRCRDAKTCTFNQVCDPDDNDYKVDFDTNYSDGDTLVVHIGYPDPEFVRDFSQRFQSSKLTEEHGIQPCTGPQCGGGESGGNGGSAIPWKYVVPGVLALLLVAALLLL
jgi:hypothetical protein